MNSNRSLRSNTNITGRSSPTFQTTKNDSFTNRSSSPQTNRLVAVREQDHETNESPSKNFNDDDRKFHKVAFERCANPPERNFITNRDKFCQALSYVGYDLPKLRIDELWLQYHREITFKLFQRILNEEKPIDQRTLEEAFETLYNKDRKYDWNTIDFDRFRTDMLEKGDRLTEEEFNKIRYLLGTVGGKIDLKKLTKTIEGNKNDCREKILIEKKEQIKDEFERPSSRIHSPKLTNNNVHIIIEPSLEKLFIPPKTRSLQMKGAFFCEYFDSPNDALYFSNGYSFELKRNTPIWITVEPTVTSHYQINTSFNYLDIRIFLFEKLSRSAERRLLHISSERTGTKTYLHLNDLPKGSYEILPVTFGGILRARTKEVNERLPIKKLRETKKGNIFKMTDDYRDALEFIFDVFDFDENKQLDRLEYNLWTLRTTGEEITDDDWLSIRDHIKLDKDEHISKEKFLKLNDFEVQDPDTTEQDLWNGLKSLGFNYALELDMMCPFKLTVHFNEFDAHLKPTSYVELAEIKKILIKFLRNKGEKIKISNPNIQCFNYQDNAGSILYAENKGSSNVRLSIQVKTSKNTALTLPIDVHKPSVINIRHDSTQIIWFAHKLDSQRAMELDANIEPL